MRAKIGEEGWMEYDEAGNGRPLILIHAFPLSRAMWQKQIENLQDCARVIAPDLRGFGGSSAAAEGMTMEEYADDLARMMEIIGVNEPAVICGISMGGYIALNFVKKYPQYVAGLILADTRAEGDDETGKANRDKMIEFARTSSAKDVVTQLLPKLIGEQTRVKMPEVATEIVRIGENQEADGIVAALKSMRDRSDARKWIGDIKVPTLVVVGEEDVLTPPAMSETLRAGIPNAKLAKIRQSGHLSNLEQPAQFNAEVRNFLTTLTVANSAK